MAADSLIGTSVGGYRVVRVLDDQTGGMGDLYLGEKDGEQVVIKRAAGAELAENQRLLYREARLLGSLKHPRLPRVYDFDKGCMVMEHVEGETVKMHLQRLRQTTPDLCMREEYLRQVVEWTWQLADVLDRLHSIQPQPVIHRDIKHTNVMVRPSGDLCLIDFGIARFFDRQKHAAGHRDTLRYGSDAWIAPEHGAGVTTPGSDLYMVGMLIRYWLTGEDPEADRKGDCRKSLPERPQNAFWNGLARITANLLQHDVQKRYTARGLAAELRKLTPADADASAAVTFCPQPQCRAEVRGAASFCPHCGTPLGMEAGDLTAASVEVHILFPEEHARTRDRIVALAEGNAPAPLERFRVYQRLRELDQDPGFGELVSLDSLPHVQRLPHQVDAVRTALQRMRGWCLLADEVGLGKTIEAGIMIKELLQRNLIRRILVIAPKDLCTQWQQELFDKFGLFFLVFGKDVEFSLAWQCDRVIAPYKVIEDRFHQREMLEQQFDLVIMDEAHHLIMRDERRGLQADQRRKMLHDFAKNVRKRYFLMLSATPLHDDLQDLHELLTLLKPGSVGDYESFQQRFMNPQDPYSPRNVGELRRRLEEVMIRRQRRLISGLRFPRRQAYRVAVSLDAAQRKVFDAFRDVVSRQLWSMAEENRSFRYALQVLVESFHSSPQAFRNHCEEFLRRFRSLLPADIQQPLKRARDAMTPSLLSGKIARAAEILKEAAGAAGHKVLVFTQYEDTLDLLHQQLPVLTGLNVVRYPSYDDADSGEQALEALTRFAGPAQVMLCAENASEGLNLQMADCMLNFDLPWDPMKLEQRIGRIQRLGQRRDKVFIYNLFLSGTVEEQMLDVLERKIDMFGATVGHVEEILGRLADDQSFDQVFLDLYRGDEAGALGQIDTMLCRDARTNAAEQLLNDLFPVDESRYAVPAPPPTAALPCPHCGSGLPASAAFCDQCGTPVPTPDAPPSACPNCARPLPADARFCDQCGKGVQP